MPDFRRFWRALGLVDIGSHGYCWIKKRRGKVAREFRKDIDYIMSHKMRLDDTFQFHCKACGKCCKIERMCC